MAKSKATYLCVKNWTAFQHYKDRRPPWIRLHRSLLDNIEFNQLSPVASKVLIMLWLIASENVDGVMDADRSKLAYRLRQDLAQVKAAVEELLAAGFLYEADERPIVEPSSFGSRYISNAIKAEVWSRDRGKCKTCGKTTDVEFDRVVPASKGGSSESSNIQLLCRACNRKKRVATQGQ